MDININLSEYTTIIFDLGEVILTNDWLIKSKEKDREFYGHYKIVPESFIASRKKYIKKLFTGKISEVSYWKKVLKDTKAADLNPGFAINLARKYQKEKPGMFELLTKLKKDGYTLGAITTSHKEIINWKREKFNLDDYFDVIVNTADVGWIKPDSRIYKYCLKKLEATPEESIFIDDTPGNVRGAEKLGLKGILFEDAAKLKQDLEKAGIF